MLVLILHGHFSDIVPLILFTSALCSLLGVSSIRLTGPLLVPLLQFEIVVVRLDLLSFVLRFLHVNDNYDDYDGDEEKHADNDTGDCTSREARFRWCEGEERI